MVNQTSATADCQSTTLNFKGSDNDRAGGGGSNAEVDMDLYSRQLGTYGLETMSKLVKLRILISGLQGAGVETAKNLILAGPGEVTLHDETIVDWPDLGSNFYLKESHVGKVTRAQGSLENLRALNPYVKVITHASNLDENLVKQQNCVVLCNHTKEQLIYMNQLCRKHNVGFIAVGVYGLCCSVFVDFGPSFMVVDLDGEEPKQAMVEALFLVNDSTLCIRCCDDKRVTFSPGELVSLSEVEGMPLLNTNGPFVIAKVTQYSLDVELPVSLAHQLGSYVRGGIVRQVKRTQLLKFRSFEEALSLPIAEGEFALPTPDLSKFGRSEQLHVALQALMEYETIHNCIPEPRDVEASKEIYDLAVKINSKYNEQKHVEGVVYVDEVDKDVVEKVAQFAVCHMNPIATFLGGVVAQEVVKLTGKYMPIRQWLYFDAFEVLDSEMINGSDPDDYKPTGSRYDDQIILWGRQFQERLARLKIFLVGAGALGCEYLKNLAMLGCSTKDQQGLITITDMDRIEISNLNRQFLFGRGHVGQSKSVVATKIIRTMNPDINVNPIEVRVGVETEQELNDQFWDGLDVVINALDNVPSRLYVDSKCVWHLKPLLESGTLGTKGNVQVVLPNMTESYGDSRDPPEESIPLCTLRHFPNRIEHALEWARDLFQGLFHDSVQEAQKIVEDSTKTKSELASTTNPSQRRGRYESMISILTLAENPTVEGAVQLAVKQFTQLFNHSIAQLLFNFPRDHVTSKGVPFWSGPKRAPHTLEMDINDEMTKLFLTSCTKLYLATIGASLNYNEDQLLKAAVDVKIEPFETQKMSIRTGENGEDQVDEIGADDEAACVKLEDRLSELVAKLPNQKFNPIEFEKDDDTNGHIDFISAAGNLRARNYDVPESERWKAKIIAGKIIPAIATTTAMVTGLASIELLKIVSREGRKIEHFKNAFANLAISFWLLSEPVPPKKQTDCENDPVIGGPVRARPPNFTTWDRVEIKLTRSSRLKELIDALERDFKTEVSILSLHNLCLYNSFFGNAKAKLEQPIGEILDKLVADGKMTELVLQKDYVVLQACCTDDDGVDVNIPIIKCCLAGSSRATC